MSLCLLLCEQIPLKVQYNIVNKNTIKLQLLHIDLFNVNHKKDLKLSNDQISYEK